MLIAENIIVFLINNPDFKPTKKEPFAQKKYYRLFLFSV